MRSGNMQPHEFPFRVRGSMFRVQGSLGAEIRIRNVERGTLDTKPGTAEGRGMNEWVAVCRLQDIVPNTGVCALVAGRQVAVFRLDDGTLHAVDNHDPFSRANVLSRGIVGDVKGELVVASPVYKHHFSLATGRCLEDPDVRIAVFPARLDGDTVCVRRAP
jgi:nitrite reductase (NADH) small subunit